MTGEARPSDWQPRWGRPLPTTANTSSVLLGFKEVMSSPNSKATSLWQKHVLLIRLNNQEIALFYFCPFLVLHGQISFPWPQRIPWGSAMTSPVAFYLCNSLISRYYTGSIFSNIQTQLLALLHILLPYILSQVLKGRSNLQWGSKTQSHSNHTQPCSSFLPSRRVQEKGEVRKQKGLQDLAGGVLCETDIQMSADSLLWGT